MKYTRITKKKKDKKLILNNKQQVDIRNNNYFCNISPSRQVIIIFKIEQISVHI